MDWLNVYILFHLFIPANFIILNKTYDNLEFISPGVQTSFTLAQAWCKHRGSTLAETGSENIWNRMILIAEEFKLNRHYLILNAVGRELPDWQWITGDTFRDERDYYFLKNNTNMYAHMSKPSRYSASISIVGSLPNCIDGSCKHSYVCEHDRDSSCNILGHDINSTQIDGICYVFHHNRFLTWFEAFYECEKNNGRLATFRNIKMEERRIAAQLEYGCRYWIGLQRWEWRWADSRQLITYARWAMSNPYQNHSCAYVNYKSGEWYSTNQCTNDVYTFVCIRDVTNCAGNPCQNGATCVGSIHEYTCRCASGFTGSRCEKRHAPECVGNLCENGATCHDSVSNVTCLCMPGFTGSQCEPEKNECDNNHCQNGGTCVGSINNHTCLCPPGFTGSKCQSPYAFTGMQILVIATVLIILVIIIINKFVVKSNDEGESINYETLIKPASHYEVLRIRDGRENVETDGNHPPSQGNAIHHPEVYYQNVDACDTSTSCPVVYVDLECVHPRVSFPT